MLLLFVVVIVIIVIIVVVVVVVVLVGITATEEGLWTETSCNFCCPTSGLPSQ